MVFAVVATLLVTLFDPLGLSNAGTMLLRDGYDRVLRSVVPPAAIVDWSDDRVLETAKKVARELSPHGAPDQSTDAILAPWSPIHVFLYDERNSTENRERATLNRSITGIPLEELTHVFRYFAETGVSVIFLDIRIINDFSYSGDFCGTVLPEWRGQVRHPDEQPSTPDDRRPVLFLAGHAPLATVNSTRLLWPERDGSPADILSREPRHTVMRCLSKAGRVLQTDWTLRPGLYPITLDEHFDPFGLYREGLAERWRFAPAVEMLRAWCGHPNSVLRDLTATCTWVTRALGAVPERQLPDLVPDWVHRTPAIYTPEQAARCAGAGRPPPGQDEQGARWAVIRDAVEQFYLQFLTPVDDKNQRVTANGCFLPPVWGGFLDPSFGPAAENDRFEQALYGAAAIIGGAYENGADWHHSSTTGSVAGSVLHGVALQSLVWRGENYVHDPKSIAKLNWLLAVELGCAVLTVALFALLNAAPPQSRVVGWMSPCRADLEVVRSLLHVPAVLAVMVGFGVLFSRGFLNAPAPDMVAVVIGVTLTFAPSIGDRLEPIVRYLLRPEVTASAAIVLVIVPAVLAAIEFGASGTDFLPKLYYLVLVGSAALLGMAEGSVSLVCLACRKVDARKG